MGIHGDTIIVGADGDDNNGRDSGSNHVFVRDRVTWTHLTKLLAPDGAANDRFGISVEYMMMLYLLVLMEMMILELVADQFICLQGTGTIENIKQSL